MAKGALGEGTCGLSWCPPRAARVGQYKSVILKREAFVPKTMRFQQILPVTPTAPSTKSGPSTQSGASTQSGWAIQIRNEAFVSLRA